MSLKDKVYYQGEGSIGRSMRLRRLQIFLDLLETVPKPCRILDVGGEPAYWEKLGFDVPDVHIVCANLSVRPSNLSFVENVQGDATAMPEYADNSFDIVYSNSVIEHLFTWENQKKMADEVRRIGQRYFVQTPNRYFPIEPHFLFPLWQFLPKSLRVSMIRRRQVGFVGPVPDLAKARKEVEEIRLLTRGEMKTLFPGATLLTERWKGLAKSFMVHKGFD
ncbi:MAG: class I SAM-dependent methyltransferase [Fimbriimonadaceae bacterium]|nr:class I SAM-dependent methyltransferase [Fimbriimonadaceae bacterium]